MRACETITIEFRALAVDDLLPEGHQARIVWEYVNGLDHVAYQWICGGVSMNHHTLSRSGCPGRHESSR